MNPDPIMTALTEQVACYRRLAKLAEAQHHHVQNGATEALLDVLRTRQAVLDQIAGYERVIAPAKQRWADYVGNMGDDARGRAESLLAETRALLEQITNADRDDVLALQQKKFNIGRQLKQTTAARQVNRSYAKAAYIRPPSRMDVQQ
jgi:hypothetical protein